MTLLVKDANTTAQPISTQSDAAGNLVPVHAPASVIAGVATPVGPAAPLPVINTAGFAAIDGSATIVAGGTAQTLFAGVVRRADVLRTPMDRCAMQRCRRRRQP